MRRTHHDTRIMSSETSLPGTHNTNSVQNIHSPPVEHIPTEPQVLVASPLLLQVEIEVDRRTPTANETVNELLYKLETECPDFKVHVT